MIRSLLSWLDRRIDARIDAREASIAAEKRRIEAEKHRKWLETASPQDLAIHRLTEEGWMDHPLHWHENGTVTLPNGEVRKWR